MGLLCLQGMAPFMHSQQISVTLIAERGASQEGLLQGPGMEGGQMSVQALHEVSLDGLLLVDLQSLHALQIFQVHAVVHAPALSAYCMPHHQAPVSLHGLCGQLPGISHCQGCTAGTESEAAWSPGVRWSGTPRPWASGGPRRGSASLAC